ncbi:hypothetical protein ACM1RC_30300, partial [Paenibacillus azoreducens]|uniref:hypothetical protein n=1 Tax=Paenibacillus azoreducens TaxID=116718 RepID=UPI0039F59AA6
VCQLHYQKLSKQHERKNTRYHKNKVGQSAGLFVFPLSKKLLRKYCEKNAEILCVIGLSMLYICIMENRMKDTTGA